MTLQLPSPPETNNIRVITLYVNSLPTSGGGASTAWSDITGKPTTAGGYGITDVYTSSAVNSLLTGKANTASTLGGYGITDAYTKAASDARYMLVGGAAYFQDVHADRGDGTGAYYFGPGGAQYLYYNGNTFQLAGGGLNVVTGAITQQSIAVGKAIWQTGSLSTADPPPASGAGTIKYQIA